MERNDTTKTPIPQARMVCRRENESAPYDFSGDMVDVYKKIQSRIDSLSILHCAMCAMNFILVYKFSYCTKGPFVKDVSARKVLIVFLSLTTWI